MAEQDNDDDVNHKKRKTMDETEAAVLLLQLDDILEKARRSLQKAHILASTASLPTASLSETAIAVSSGAASSTATAGHSNTDHIISQSGDDTTDRIQELKRKYIRRLRSSQPEARGSNRWDKPKVPGERRRRIVRDKDAPEAPAEPPPSGYTIFVGQMTCKIRHDRPNEPHDQTRVMQEISTYWKHVMTDNQRQDYIDFADDARDEYLQQLRQFRATGTFTPSERFEKKPGANIWVRKRDLEKTTLERELDTYETYSFRPRPPELDEAYRQREEQSKLKRKLKTKGLVDDYGNPLVQVGLSPAEQGQARLESEFVPAPEDGSDDESIMIEQV